MPEVVVVGYVGRDLVLRADRLPVPGGRAPVTERAELLGGVANQAAGCRQMGWSTGLVGVVGDDAAGDGALAEARALGIDPTGVARRAGCATPLFVDVVLPGGDRRVLEHVPAGAALTEDDVAHAGPVLASARACLVQADQPGPAVLRALAEARRGGGLVVLDGGNEDPAVTARAVAGGVVVRADGTEAERLCGRRVDGVADALEAARALVRGGARAVALAADGADVLVWPDGEVVLPLLGERPVDPTGAGDAFVVGLVSALLRGHDVETAGWWAAAAAALTVDRTGGRPDLTPDAVAELAERRRR